MPSSRVLIASQTLSGSAANVTFSSIPSGYKDLILKWSARCDTAQPDAFVRFNSDSAANYSRIEVYMSGTTVYNGLVANQTSQYQTGSNDRSDNTANTFSNGEIYIPSYTASQNKPVGRFNVAEDNSTTSFRSYVVSGAHLWRNTAAITSITMSPASDNFVAGSTFYLYGLSN